MNTRVLSSSAGAAELLNYIASRTADSCQAMRPRLPRDRRPRRRAVPRWSRPGQACGVRLGFSPPPAHTGLAAGDALLMDSTRLSNTLTCQPQQRNMHGRVFGGFLMRRAYELAFATVHTFAGSRPRFLQVDRVRIRPRCMRCRGHACARQRHVDSPFSGRVTRHNRLSSSAYLLRYVVLLRREIPVTFAPTMCPATQLQVNGDQNTGICMHAADASQAVPVMTEAARRIVVELSQKISALGPSTLVPKF